MFKCYNIQEWEKMREYFLNFILILHLIELFMIYAIELFSLLSI